MATASSRSPIGLWPLALGATGFVAGFVGPIILNPDANQGPLVGIFITGPGGALAGLVLGVAFRLLPVSNAQRSKALVIACLTLGLGTLFYCLPQPAVLGHVIDAQVEECARPSSAMPAALVEWEAAVERVTWTSPPADWKETALRNVSRDTGVVLSVRVIRRSTIYQHRKPWDFRRRSASAWMMVGDVERYYASDAGDDCSEYLARDRALYAPFFRRSRSGPNGRARAWPPTDTTGFLRLLELGPVPGEYQRLIEARQ